MVTGFHRNRYDETPLVALDRNRRISEAAYAKDPLDADNLTRWGKALLGLSSYQSHRLAREMLRDAISKLKESLKVDPAKSETHWCLGNALTTLASLSPNVEDAQGYFSDARDHLAIACGMEPRNRLYHVGLKLASDQHFIMTCEAKQGNGLYCEFVEIAAKDTDLLSDLEKEMRTSSSSSSSPLASTEEQSSAKKYGTIWGFVNIPVGVAAWVGLGFSKKRIPRNSRS